MKPSDRPVDTEAVLRLLEVVESAGVAGSTVELEEKIYRRMLPVRHNARRVAARSWQRAEVVEREEVLVTPAHGDELVPDLDAVRTTDGAELLAVMRSRRSARAFANRAIPDDQLDLILEAGRWAPSGGNAQPWELLVLRTPEAKRSVVDALVPTVELLRSLDPTFPGVANPRSLLAAGVLVLVYGDLRAMAAYPYPLPRHARWALFEQSLAMCVQNMWLMATRLGLAATNYTMGHPVTDQRLREVFGVPDHYALPTMLVLGYPRHHPPPRPRRPLDQLVHHERFDASRVRSDEQLIDDCYATGVRGRGFR